MAFERENLNVFAYCSGFTMWYYRSNEDSIDAISNAGYFNSAAKDLGRHDLIIVTDRLGQSGIRRIKDAVPGAITTGQPV